VKCEATSRSLIAAREAARKAMSEPTPCPSGELTIIEVPPCPSCEAVQNGPYSVSIDAWTETAPQPPRPKTMLAYAPADDGTIRLVEQRLCDCGGTAASVNDALAAEILADRLEEQGCTADAELVRRLAGLTGPGESGAG
jgi:hypothetical protein